MNERTDLTVDPAEQLPATGNPHSILVVDDERVVCNAIARQLQNAGYAVHTAYNGTDAMALLEPGSIDLALIDIRMPKVTGFDVLRYIQEKAPNTKTIMMTAYADIKSAIDSISFGAVDIISKPVDVDEVILTIGRCLE